MRGHSARWTSYSGEPKLLSKVSKASVKEFQKVKEVTGWCETGSGDDKEMRKFERLYEDQDTQNLCDSEGKRDAARRKEGGLSRDTHLMGRRRKQSRKPRFEKIGLLYS